MSFSASLLELRGAGVRYGARTALRSVSLSIHPGEFVALVGPNGSGKTSLLRAVLGLVPLAGGEVVVAGTPLASLDYRARALRMAWLPQEEHPQDNVRLFDYVLFGRFAHIPPFYSEEDEDYARCRESLESVGLWDRRDSGIWEVSGGERQRVLLARALAQDAPILLLDEPTTHLDIGSQLELTSRLVRLCESGRRCAVAALHDLNLAAQFATRIVVLSHGRVVADGPPAKVLSKPLLRDVWGVDVELRRDLRSGRPFLLPRLPEDAPGEAPAERSGRGPIHVIGGGGAAAPLLHALVEEGWQVTCGAVPLLDSDAEAAQELGLRFSAEIPFSPMGEETCARTRGLLREARVVVVAPTAFGPGNVANLELLLERGRPQEVIFVQGSAPFDFTGGKATTIRESLLRSGAIQVRGITELEAELERRSDVVDGLSAAGERRGAPP